MHKQRSSAPDSWILNPSSVGTSFEKLWQLNRICIPDSVQVLSSCTCMHTYLHARMHTNINQYHRHLAYLVLQMEANKLQIAPSLTSPQIRSWGFLHALHVPGVCGGIVVVFLHFGGLVELVEPTREPNTCTVLDFWPKAYRLRNVQEESSSYRETRQSKKAPDRGMGLDVSSTICRYCLKTESVHKVQSYANPVR